MMSSRRFRRVVARSATASLLTLGLLAVAPQFSSSVSVKASAILHHPHHSAPSGPATVSTKTTEFGKVLSIGSGANAVALCTYSRPKAPYADVSSCGFGCSNGANPIGLPCDSVLWPALLTEGSHRRAGSQQLAPGDSDPQLTCSPDRACSR